MERVVYPALDLRIKGWLHGEHKITHAKGYNENKYNNLSNWKKNKNIIPINKNRIKKAEENIKLRRKIPLLDKRKTLLRYMNITINKKNK